MGLLTWITDYLEQILNAIAGNLWLSVLFIFLVCVGEAVFIVGLLVPSLPILLLTGGLIAAGKLPFWPIYLRRRAGARDRRRHLLLDRPLLQGPDQDASGRSRTTCR